MERNYQCKQFIYRFKKMLFSGFSVIFFGLAAAVSWGTGDFIGGLASKRTSAYTVVVISQFVSLLLLVVGALLIPEGSNSFNDLLLGAIAGILGAAGLVALYSGLARGPMGVIAPVTALIAAIFPVFFSFLKEGLPALWSIVGFVFALIAILLISQGEEKIRPNLSDLKLPIIAGLGFGGFFILIDQVSTNAILWPLVSARSASIIIILGIGLMTRKINIPVTSKIPIIALAGIFDTSGNVFFAFATRIGRLDITAILGSLYPAVTVLLAWTLLQERLSSRQWIGVMTAIIAIILITI